MCVRACACVFGLCVLLYLSCVYVRLSVCLRVCEQMAKKDSTLAEALLQEERERGLGQLSDSDWDTMLDDFGTATPRDFLISAPSQKIKER